MNRVTYVILALTAIALATFLFLQLRPAATPAVQSMGQAEEQASAIVDSLYNTPSTSSVATVSPLGQESAPQAATSTTAATAPQKVTSATIHTSKGDITVKFAPKLAPIAVANFIKLAQAGFYNGVKFHRVIKGFMIQGGDPFTKDDAKIAAWGTGGPGYAFNDEVTAESKNTTGTISMANSGPNTNGSQFFINVADNVSLDGHYTVFGSVTSGMDVVKQIENTPTDSSDRPTSPVIMTSVTVK